MSKDLSRTTSVSTAHTEATLDAEKKQMQLCYQEQQDYQSQLQPQQQRSPSEGHQDIHHHHHHHHHHHYHRDQPQQHHQYSPDQAFDREKGLASPSTSLRTSIKIYGKQLRVMKKNLKAQVKQSVGRGRRERRGSVGSMGSSDSASTVSNHSFRNRLRARWARS